MSNASLTIQHANESFYLNTWDVGVCLVFHSSVRLVGHRFVKIEQLVLVHLW